MDSREITLDPTTTALILIDLQNGLVNMPLAPSTGHQVINVARQLADYFRKFNVPVVLVNVTYTRHQRRLGRVCFHTTRQRAAHARHQLNRVGRYCDKLWCRANCTRGPAIGLRSDMRARRDGEPIEGPSRLRNPTYLSVHRAGAHFERNPRPAGSIASGPRQSIAVLHRCSDPAARRQAIDHEVGGLAADLGLPCWTVRPATGARPQGLACE